VGEIVALRDRPSSLVLSLLLVLLLLLLWPDPIFFARMRQVSSLFNTPRKPTSDGRIWTTSKTRRSAANASRGLWIGGSCRVAQTGLPARILKAGGELSGPSDAHLSRAAFAMKHLNTEAGEICRVCP
jgi:hypothetical protein